MKKEKQVKAHTRRTKSGKTVTVKAHSAKYDAAEAALKAVKSRKGAGKELEKNRSKYSFEEYSDAVNAMSNENWKEFEKGNYEISGKHYKTKAAYLKDIKKDFETFPLADRRMEITYMRYPSVRNIGRSFGVKKDNPFVLTPAQFKALNSQEKNDYFSRSIREISRACSEKGIEEAGKKFYRVYGTW